MTAWLSTPGKGLLRSEHGVRSGYRVAMVLILALLLIPYLLNYLLNYLFFSVLFLFKLIHFHSGSSFNLPHLLFPMKMSVAQITHQLAYILQTLQGFFASVIMFISTMLALWVMARHEGRSIWFYFFNKTGGLKYFPIGIGCAFIVFFPLVIAIFKSHHVVDIPYLFSIFVAVLSCILVGFHEELLFRGYVQKNLMCSMGFFPALIVSSLLFGLAHVPNLSIAMIVHLPFQTLAYTFEHFCSGVLLCVGLRQTGTLWWSIGFHSTWDFIITWYKPEALVKTHLVTSHQHGFHYAVAIIFFFGVFQLILAGLFFIVKRAPRESLALTAS